MKQTLFIIAYIAYFAVGLLQWYATIKGIEVLLGLNWFVSFIISFFLAYIPIIGTITGIYGAVKGLDWNLTSAIILFCWPYLIYILIIILTAVGSFRANNQEAAKEKIGKNNYFIPILIGSVLYLFFAYFLYQEGKDIYFISGAILGSSFLILIVTFLLNYIFSISKATALIIAIVIIIPFQTYRSYKFFINKEKLNTTIGELSNVYDKRTFTGSESDDENGFNPQEETYSFSDPNELEQANILLNFLQEWNQKINKFAEQYNTALDRYKVDEIFSLETAQSELKIKKKINDVEMVNKVLVEYRTNVQEIMQPGYLKNELMKKGISKDNIDVFMTGYNDQLEDKINLRNRYFNIQSELFIDSYSYLLFMESVFDNYKIVDESILFNQQEDLEKYNSYIDKLYILIDEENKVIEDFQKQRDKFNKILQKLSNDINQ